MQTFVRVFVILALCAAGLWVSEKPVSAATWNVTTTSDVVNGGDGVLSLREAVIEANASGTDDVIQLTAGTYLLTICAEGDLEVSAAQDLAIIGNGATIEQTCTDQRVFDKTDLANAVLSVSDVVLHGGPNSGVDLDGAAIRAQSQLILDGVEMTNFDAGFNGEVVKVDFGAAVHDLDMTDTTIDGNTGSAIRNANPIGVRIDGSTITNNTGSGISVADGNPIEITGTSISGNGGFGVSTSGQGFGNQPVVTVTDSTIDDNGQGGLRCSTSCRTLTMTNTAITNNGHGAVGTNGGGIWIDMFGTGSPAQVASATITGSTITGNAALHPGGGVLIAAAGTLDGPTPTTLITGTTISGNTATCVSCDGGGISVRAGNLFISGSEIADNAADRDGGGIAHDQTAFDNFDDPTSFALSTSTVSGNSAGDDGGGVYVHANLQTFADTHIAENVAGFDGGGVVVGGVAPDEPGTAGLTAVTLSGNNAGSFGGGLWVGFPDGSAAFLQNSTVTGNSAAAGGGLAAAVTEFLSLQHVTVMANSAAVAANIGHSGTVELSASVIGNPLGGGVNCASLPTVATAPAVDSSGFNWSSDATCAAGPGDVVDPGGDPLLGPLADNGGWAPTMLPAATSPLVSLIPTMNCPLSEDQRYAVRPEGSGCEPGSVEVPDGAPPAPIMGGNGDDDLVGTSGPDVIFGGNGNDTISGLGGNDHLVGGNGKDVLIGGPGNDILEGGNGKDVLIADSAGDVLDGGHGRDDCWFFGATSPVDC